MLGQALLRRLAREDCALPVATHAAVDLRHPEQVARFIADARPDAIILAAARVGGIAANLAAPAGFLHDNLLIAANTIHAACQAGVPRLLFVASSAAYPPDAPQPMTETMLFGGLPEPSHAGYATAKRAGMQLVQAYRAEYGCNYVSAVPTNLYGPQDRFDLASGHVVPALIRKVHEAMLHGAPSIELWGSGKTRREFLHADDCADALVHLLVHYDDPEPVNVGTGLDIEIMELLRLIARIAGYTGQIVPDPSKPEGPPRKLLDVSRLTALGWRASIDLETGLAEIWHAYRSAPAAAPAHARAA